MVLRAIMMLALGAVLAGCEGASGKSDRRGPDRAAAVGPELQAAQPRPIIFAPDPPRE